MTTLDLDIKSKSEWIEMFPFGVAVGASGMRPVMIFKDKQERRALPVWMSPLDAGIAVSQSETFKSDSPHELSAQILSGLGVKVEKCLFHEVRSNQQLVELHLIGSRKLKKIEARADAAISFCLRMGCRFFAKVEYIERSRVLESEVVLSMAATPDSEVPRYLN